MYSGAGIRPETSRIASGMSWKNGPAYHIRPAKRYLRYGDWYPAGSCVPARSSDP